VNGIESSTKPPIVTDRQLKAKAPLVPELVRPVEDDFMETLPNMAAESKIAMKNAGSVHGVLVNEGREKKFNFPARGIGLLCRFQPPDSIVEICRAIGTVYVRSDVPLILKIQGPSADAAIDTPSFFSLIDPSEFLGLMLVGFSDETRTNPSLL
jgi:hypothetical protein